MHETKQQDIPAALAQFEHLPNSANVAQPVVEGLYGISGPTLWRRVKDGGIPKPRQLSPGCTRWNVGELRRGGPVARGGREADNASCSGLIQVKPVWALDTIIT